MGGFGSGRHGGKRTTDEEWVLDIRQVQRAGRLTPGQSFSWQWSRNGKLVAYINLHSGVDRVTLDYKMRDRGGEWVNMNYSVRLSWTSCTYGGQRAWWLCPVLGCGRRVAVLFSGNVFACRHCHQLVYRSQREQSNDRAISYADKIRNRLGWGPGIANGHGSKPKGMHWRTFEQLCVKHDAKVLQSFDKMAAKLGMFTSKLQHVNSLTEALEKQLLR